MKLTLKQHLKSLVYWLPLLILGQRFSDTFVCGVLIGFLLKNLDVFYAELAEIWAERRASSN